MIDKWLKAGVLEQGILHRMAGGTPQGGVISPSARKHLPALCAGPVVRGEGEATRRGAVPSDPLC